MWRAPCNGIRFAALSSFLCGTLLAGGCSGDGGQPGQPPTDGARDQRTEGSGTDRTSPSLAPMRSRPPQDTLASNEGNDFRAEVNRVESERNGFVTVYWTLTNISDERQSVQEYLGQRKYGGVAYFSEQFPWYRQSDVDGVEIVQDGKRYLSVTDSSSNCVCSTSTLGGAGFLPSGESLEAYSSYYLPEDVESVSVSFPDIDPMEDIRVAGGEDGG